MLGKPLLAYTLESTIEAGICGDIVVSTDSAEIASVANRYDQVKTIKRPDELATDRSSTEDVLLHAISYMETNFGRQYDTVITMQPTSPLRRPETIKDFVQQFEKLSDKFDSQMTFTESRSDYWVKDLNGSFSRLFPNAPRRRQERTPIYIENSAIYITKLEIFKEKHSVLGNHLNGYLISEMEGVDINEPIDLKLAEFYLMQQSGDKV